MKNKTIKTIWELWGYDVWGNKEDGYQVNDLFCFNRLYVMNLKIEVNNPHTEHEFLSAYPSDFQVKKAFDVGCRELDLNGDATTIYVDRSSDGYPIGEMRLISHNSLCPIQEKNHEYFNF